MNVLNVGGHSKHIALPEQYAGFDHVLLDIDPSVAPDVCCDARTLTTLPAGGYDTVYCSHNLEHFAEHDVPRVLAGFLHVLRDGGLAQIRVPDLGAVMADVATRQLDIEDVLYESPGGPIRVLDVLYGWQAKVAASGQDFFQHKTGFTLRSLARHVMAAGFTAVYGGAGQLELGVLAVKGELDPALRARFLPDEAAAA